ncbi:MAG: site-2 protease family protein [Coriobacteriia bacterium]|nr:site-2 protease family protein [Coriobacteriia bacterium]
MGNFAYAVLSIVCFVPAIVVHEIAHGFAAYKMGDTTAKDAKRLTLNPLRHIDPFGTVILPLLLAVVGLPVFGFAKPVPYNPNRLKNKKAGELVIGLAGPCSNLLMALAAALVGYAITLIPHWSSAIVLIYSMVYYFALINLCLLFFNLLPIPPLDGSSIIVPLLPEKSLPTWYRIQRQALPVLIILVVGLPYLTGIIGYSFNPLQSYIQFTAGNLVDFLFSF